MNRSVYWTFYGIVFFLLNLGLALAVSLTMKLAIYKSLNLYIAVAFLLFGTIKGLYARNN